MPKKSTKTVTKQPIFTLRNIILSLFLLGTAAVYLHNMTRDIYSGDIGDLVTAAYIFGVAHPPGYPLITSIGWLLSHLPFPFPVVTRITLLSVLASVLGVYFFYKLALKASQNFVVAMLSAATLAFSYLFWFYTEVPEVFGVNNFFVIALFYFVVQFRDTKKAKYLYIFAFLTGLAFTDQHQIIVIYPALLIILIASLKTIWQLHWKMLLVLLIFFAGFLPYIYVPFAAAHHPAVNWDNPSNLQNFIHMFLRLDYMTYKPGVLNFYQRLPILNVYTSTLLNNFSLLGVLVCLAGLPLLFRRSKLLFSTYIFAFLLSGPLFIFTIVTFLKDPDALAVIERFYMISFIVFLFLLPYGLQTIFYIFRKYLPREIYAYAGILIFAVVPLSMIQYNFPKNDLSRTQIGDNFAADILGSLPKDAYFFPNTDIVVFNSWYLHYVLGYRPDVHMYFLKGPVNDRFDTDIAGNYFRDHPESKKDPQAIFSSKVVQIMKQHAVYTTFSMPDLPASVVSVPEGLSYHIMRREDVPDRETYLQLVKQNIAGLHTPVRDELPLYDQNLVTPTITSYYSGQLVNIGTFVDQWYGDPVVASAYFNRAIAVDSENHLAYASLGIAQWEAHHDCPDAEKNIGQAIDKDIQNKAYYLNLAMVYKNCKATSSQTAALKKKYKYLFDKDLDKENFKSVSESQ